MHGLPKGTRFDIRGLQPEPHAFSVDAPRTVRIHGDRREPAIAEKPGWLVEQVDSFVVFEEPPIALENRPARSDSLRQNLQLPSPDRGEHVAQSIVVTDV